MVLAGAAVWFGVSGQLKAEKIPINGDTPFMNSVFGSAEGSTPKEVKGPLGAMAQAEGIKKHTPGLPSSFGFPELDGKTAGEIAHIRSAKEYKGAGTAEVDAKMTALWNMMNTSSFLRSSLLLSAMAFGVALLVLGIGVVVALAGLGLLTTGKELAATAVPREPLVKPDKTPHLGAAPPTELASAAVPQPAAAPVPEPAPPGTPTGSAAAPATEPTPVTPPEPPASAPPAAPTGSAATPVTPTAPPASAPPAAPTGSAAAPVTEPATPTVPPASPPPAPPAVP
jgi:hypothetical protein